MLNKKFFAVLAAACLVLGLVGCQQNSDVSTGQADTEQATEQTEQTTVQTTTQTEPTSEATEETTSGLLIKPQIGNNSDDGVFTIDSGAYPLDAEEITIRVDTSMYAYGAFEYSCIDLANLKNFSNLKRLNISSYNDAAVNRPIELINCDSTAGLNNLEEITLGMVSCDGDWLTEINSLKKLNIDWCDFNWEFLHDLPQVETLTLYRCDITELNFINDMKSLSELSLTNIGIEKFEIEGENNSVKRLTLSENAFTDISGIAKLRGLEYLYAVESHLDDLEKQKKELQESLPECEINIYT